MAVEHVIGCGGKTSCPEYCTSLENIGVDGDRQGAVYTVYSSRLFSQGRLHQSGLSGQFSTADTELLCGLALLGKPERIGGSASPGTAGGLKGSLCVVRSDRVLLIVVQAPCEANRTAWLLLRPIRGPTGTGHFDLCTMHGDRKTVTKWRDTEAKGPQQIGNVVTTGASGCCGPDAGMTCVPCSPVRGAGPIT